MLLLSIHPRYADAILAGMKTVELRRQRPRINSGLALIYASSPRMELVASFRIAGIIAGPLQMLWQLVHDRAGVSRPEFSRYFQGLSTGVAIEISDVQTFVRPVPLSELRERWRGFHPPQGFRYVQLNELNALGVRRKAG